MRLGFLELAILFGFVVLFWGAAKLPGLARATKEAKDILKEDSKKEEEDIVVDDKQQEETVNEQ